MRKATQHVELVGVVGVPEAGRLDVVEAVVELDRPLPDVAAGQSPETVGGPNPRRGAAVSSPAAGPVEEDEAGVHRQLVELLLADALHAEVGEVAAHGPGDGEPELVVEGNGRRPLARRRSGHDRLEPPVVPVVRLVCHARLVPHTSKGTRRV